MLLHNCNLKFSLVHIRNRFRQTRELPYGTCGFDIALPNPGHHAHIDAPQNDE